MTNATDLEKALLQGVEACGLGLPIAGENLPFTHPQDGTPWARVLLELGQPFVATLGNGGDDGYIGYIQLDLNVLPHSGTAEARAKAEIVEAFFTAGTRLNYGSARATVTACGRSRGREVEGWYRVSMTISWQARVKRN